MTELFSELTLFALVLTFGAFQLGLLLQKKWPSPLCNPLLIAVILVMGTLVLLRIPNESYQTSMAGISWLLTPATVCLALPMYNQVKTLKKNLPAILAGVTAGTVVSLVGIFLMCKAFSLEQAITVSLLPKSITTAMGIVLSEQAGGIQALTAAAIVVTGILGSLVGTVLCKLLRITDPIAQGVAFGTASHVIGTTRAAQVGQLQGAVSSLSLAVAGILTAVLFPLLCMLL